MIEEKEDICYLCLRIPSSEVLKFAHKIWVRKPKTARKLGLEACKKIKEVYKTKPTYFCGRGKPHILAGLFYYLSVINDCRVTQIKLGDIFQVTDVSVRNLFEYWVKFYHVSVDDFRKEFMPMVYTASLQLRKVWRKCDVCGRKVHRTDRECPKCGSKSLSEIEANE